MYRGPQDLPKFHTLPREDERPEIRSDEDAYNDIAVVVHSKQHNKVRNRELQHVQQSADSLLDHVGPEFLFKTSARYDAIRFRRAVLRGTARNRCRRRSFTNMLADEVSIILFTRAAKEFQDHDEDDDSDARAGEHAVGSDVPGTGEKAFASRSQHIRSKFLYCTVCTKKLGRRKNGRNVLTHSSEGPLTGVNGIPIPQHLFSQISRSVDTQCQASRLRPRDEPTEILQELPPPILMPPMLFPEAVAIAAAPVPVLDAISIPPVELDAIFIFMLCQ